MKLLPLAIKRLLRKRKTLLLLSIIVISSLSVWFLLTRPQKPHVDGNLELVFSEAKKQTENSNPQSANNNMIRLDDNPNFLFSFNSSKEDKPLKKVDFENDTMTLTLRSQRGKTYILASNLTKNEEKKQKSWFPKVSAQEQMTLEAKIVDDPQGSFRVEMPDISQLPDPEPGKYTLHISWENNESVVSAAQDFTWGVLTLNTNKSVYVPGEKAKIALAVLDEEGKMVCDAKVELRITSPVIASESEAISYDKGIATDSASPRNDIMLSTENGKITVNHQCKAYEFSLIPDYETEYQVGGVGTYSMSLTATTKNGTYTISDQFEVRDTVPFDVERTTATRIYPAHVYPVLSTITAREDFSGEIIETVPERFVIYKRGEGNGVSDGDGSLSKVLPKELGEVRDDFEVKPSTDGKTKQLVWKVTMKKGDIITLDYHYDAPDKSPDFYTLGPLRFGNSFSEQRLWNIAVDAMKSQMFTSAGTGSWSSTGTSVVVETWGGGGGVSAPAANNSRGGGGGGAYSLKTLSVTNGNSYNYVVGSAGTTAGAAGGDTCWNTNSCASSPSVLAKGGNGNTGTGTAAGGASGSGVGDTLRSGGQGAAQTSTTVSGGGGSAAGSTAGGNNASGSTGGSAVNDFGGRGGNGVNSAGTGEQGQNYGGGAGGSARSGGTGNAGVAGAAGLIRIGWYEIEAANVTQYNYRWRSDDGNETSGSSLANENTAYTSMVTGTKYRLRFTIWNNNATASDSAATNYTYRLEYGTKGAGCSSATYSAITSSGTSAAFTMTTTSNYADGDASTNAGSGPGVLSNPSGSFTAGKLVESTSNTTGAITLNAGGEYTEVEYTLQPNSSVSYDTRYCFRLTNAGSALNTYTQYAEAQVPNVPVTTFNQRQGSFENDQNGTNTSNTVKIGERMKVKIQVDTGSGNYSYTRYKLQYDKNDSNWVDVKPSGEIRAARSEVIKGERNTGTGDAGSCTGGVTARTGYWTSGKSVTKTLKIYGSACHDIGFVIDTKNATVNTTYRFRLVDLLGSTTTYVAYPSFTTVASGSNTKRYSKSKLAASSTSYGELKHLLDNQGYTNVGTDDSTRDILWNRSGVLGADVTFDAEASSNNLGPDIASAGDFNGDGYSDMVLGANGYTGGGRAYIFYGKSYFSSSLNVSSADAIIQGEASSNFGTAVSSGDVNGDGYSDVIVGADGYSSSTGRAYIFYGSSGGLSSPLAATSANVIITGEASSNSFGTTLSSAGDINKDGYTDVVIGATGYSSSTGRVYILYGSSSLSASIGAGSANVLITGQTASDSLGASVASAGDVNGDGYDDIIMSATGFSTSAGRAYIFYGSSGGLSSPLAATSANVIITGEASSSFGVVNGAGDVNSDGYPDFIVGAASYSSNRGRVYLFYGSSSLSSSIAASAANVIISAETTNTDLGISVSSAGDINNDGYADFSAGADIYSSSSGRVYIFYGSSSLSASFSASSANVILSGAASARLGWVTPLGDVNGDGMTEFMTGAFNAGTGGQVYLYYKIGVIDEVMEKNITGEATSNSFGVSIASAGDVNGDGYSDMIVGASGYSSSTGRAYIYLGGVSVDTTVDIRLTGGATSDSFGVSVASAGDVNGDGYDDVIVGATGALKAYIFYGSSSLSANIAASAADVTLSGSGNFGISVASAGDVTGDGYDDVIVGADTFTTSTGRASIFYGGASMDTTADVVINGETTNNHFGVLVNSAGDVNGDGYVDVIIGASTYSSNTGRAYIFYGSSSMTTPLAASSANQIMTGEATSDWFGVSVSSAGDVNGDGYSDVIVGSDDGGTGGRAYLYYGGSSMDATVDVKMSAEASSNIFGRSVNSAGDVNGDGYSDVIVGAADYSSSTGRAYIFYGSPGMSSSIAGSSADVIMTGEAGTSRFGIYVNSGDVNRDGYSDLVVGAYQYSSSTGRAYISLGGTSNYIPTYTFADYSSTACGSLTSIDATWNGQSSNAASVSNIKLEVYRFGATNAWETVTTNSSLAANTDGNITGQKTTNLSEYCDGSNWSYWRVYQASGTINFQTDYWNLTFTSAPVDTNSSTLRGGATIRGGTTLQ